MRPSKPTGRLEVVHGAMFAGKTEHLIARLRAEQARGRTVRAFKHAIDGRYSEDHLVTHPGDRFDALRVRDAAAILEHVVDVEVVAVDEAHFFKLALVPVVQALLERGLTVLVAGVTYDASGRPFDPLPQLVALAHEVVVREAPCRVCGQPSLYTQRMVPVSAEFHVGGAGDYEPRCAAHFTPQKQTP